MSKKPLTRDALLARLEELDNFTETAKLRTELARLTTENAALVDERNTLERRVSQFEKDMATIRTAVQGVDRRQRAYGVSASDATLREMTGRAARLSQAHVLVGIKAGTHDPATGLEYTVETKPARNLSQTVQRITAGELERAFPELSDALPVAETASADAMVLPPLSVD